MVGRLGNGRRLVVADVRRKRGNEHQRTLHQLGDARPVGLDAARQMMIEAVHRIGQQPQALQHVVRDQRLEHIELEVAGSPADIDRHIVAEHLRAHHGERLALRGVDLARHDGTARLVLGNANLAQPAARTGSQPAHVIGDFHQCRRERFERAVQEHQRLVPGERGELVLGAGERQPGLPRQLGGHAHAERRMGVEPGAHRGATHGQCIDRPQRGVDGAPCQIELGDVARKFLPEGERRGVLQMGAADFDDVGERFRLGLQGGAQGDECGQQILHGLRSGGHMHGRGENVIRRLPHIDLIVGMHAARQTHATAQQHRGAVGEHLVHVHIGLRARAGLPDRQRKLVGIAFGNDLIGRLDNGLRGAQIEFAQLGIHAGAGPLDQRQGADELARHLLGGNREMLQRALRLRAPQMRLGHFDGTERVGLDPVALAGLYQLLGSVAVTVHASSPACISKFVAPAAQHCQWRGCDRIIQPSR